MADPTQLKHVPIWLAQRYSFIAALEDNPLYLALAGKAYCGRGWFGPRRKSWFARKRVLLWLFSVAFVLCLVPPFIQGLILLMIAGRYSANFGVALREEAKSGRLTDFYLSMDSKTIVDALVVSRVLPTRWGLIGYIIFSIALACATTAILLFGPRLPFYQALIILNAMSCAAVPLIPIAHVAAAINCYRQISRAVQSAAGDTILDQFRRDIVLQVKTARGGFKRYFWPVSAVLVISVFSSFVFVILLNASSPLILPIGSITAGAVFAILYYQRNHFLIYDVRNQAIRDMRQYLARIIELNPFTEKS
ncbi:MAG: hypothetical protein NTX50_20980 [Candidatus Sumerlaeota bacterium]|nr:hypothetical protein [Candidatus Sumerlaeota bacterium]